MSTQLLEIQPNELKFICKSIIIALAILVILFSLFVRVVSWRRHRYYWDFFLPRLFVLIAMYWVLSLLTSVPFLSLVIFFLPSIFEYGFIYMRLLLYWRFTPYETVFL